MDRHTDVAGATKTSDEPPVLVEVGAAFLAAFLTPWAISKMWDWFVVPLGAPAIGYWHGMGFLAFLLLGKALCSKTPIGGAFGVVLSFGIAFFAMRNMQ